METRVEGRLFLGEEDTGIPEARKREKAHRRQRVSV